MGQSLGVRLWRSWFPQNGISPCWELAESFLLCFTRSCSNPCCLALADVWNSAVCHICRLVPPELHCPIFEEKDAERRLPVVAHLVFQTATLVVTVTRRSRAYACPAANFWFRSSLSLGRTWRPLSLCLLLSLSSTLVIVLEPTFSALSSTSLSVTIVCGVFFSRHLYFSVLRLGHFCLFTRPFPF